MEFAKCTLYELVSRIFSPGTHCCDTITVHVAGEVASSFITAVFVQGGPQAVRQERRRWSVR